MIRISVPDIGPGEEAAVLAVLRSGQLARGPVVADFEALCCQMASTQYAVAVANGTVALEAALAASGIGPGDEVLVPAFTFAATANAVIRSGAKVTFVDIDPVTYCIDPAALAAAITPATKAVLPVHLFGHPAQMALVSTLAAEYELTVIEDAAQAHGARIADRPVGGWGLAGCFSFYATKNVSCGEGGVITTSSRPLADRLHRLTNQGMASRYEYVEVGTNWRMSDLHAAVAVGQMRRLASIRARRAENAAALAAGLADSGLVLPETMPGTVHAWHQFTVRVPEGSQRDDVVRRLAAQGVAAGVYYPAALPDLGIFKDHPLVSHGHCPEARRAANEVLSLPVHQMLSEGDLGQIVSAMLRSI